MISLSSTHRNQATSGYVPGMPLRTCDSRGYVAYQGRDALDRDVRSNKPIRPCRGTSYKASAGSIIRLPLCNGRMSPTGGHDGPVSAGWLRSPDIPCPVPALSFVGGSSSARDSRRDRRAMWRFRLPEYSQTFAATTRGMLRRRSYETGLCWVSCGPRLHTFRTRTRLAARAERGMRLAGRAAATTPSGIASSRTSGPALTCSAPAPPLFRKSNTGEARLSSYRHLDRLKNRISVSGVWPDAGMERCNACMVIRLALHGIYTSARPVSNV